MKKIRLFAIIYIFFVFSLKCFGQESNKYVLIYEDFEKISEIQELIENSNTKILEKYGVSLKDLDFLENLEFQRFFIGYQVRIIDGIKLLEMKYDRSRIENFLIANNLSFSVIKRDMKHMHNGIHDLGGKIDKIYWALLVTVGAVALLLLEKIFDKGWF